MTSSLLLTRRSIRRFRPDPVPDSVIWRILATAIHAPSAHNLQPWRFVVLPPSVRGARARLGAALTAAMRRDMAAEGVEVNEIEERVARSLRRINEAPVVIVLCRDVDAVREQKVQDEIMAIQSIANAGTYLLLAAHDEGLGANWICWPLYAQAETRSALGLPENWQPQAMFFLGYPDETPKEKVLKPVEEVTWMITENEKNLSG